MRQDSAESHQITRVQLSCCGIAWTGYVLSMTLVPLFRQLEAGAVPPQRMAEFAGVLQRVLNSEPGTNCYVLSAVWVYHSHLQPFSLSLAVFLLFYKVWPNAGMEVIPQSVPVANAALHAASPELRSLGVEQLGKALQVHSSSALGLAHCTSLLVPEHKRQPLYISTI